MYGFETHLIVSQFSKLLNCLINVNVYNIFDFEHDLLKVPRIFKNCIDAMFKNVFLLNVQSLRGVIQN
jgi:hypothetical protein